MQALSLAVHIPIVCFGIAFPAMILFVHGLYLRTGEPHFKALAKRWSKVALTLFAVGVVTGTILSFEFGLLWPDFMRHVRRGLRRRVRPGGRRRSSSRRSSSPSTSTAGTGCRAARTSSRGVPIVITGFFGSFCVIAVNGWMNHPQGFGVARRRRGRPASRGTRCSTATCGTSCPHVPGRLHRRRLHRRRRLRARPTCAASATRYHRTGLVVALSFAALAAPAQVIVGDWAGRRSPRASRSSSPRSRALPDDDEGRAVHDRRLVRRRATTTMNGGIEIPYLLSLLADHDPNATVVGLDTVPPDDRPPVNIVRYSFQIMVGIGHAAGAARRPVRAHAVAPAGACRGRSGSTAASIAAGPLALVALIAGWITTEVGRQPWIVYEVMRVEDAVTGSDGLEVGFAVLVAVYLLLARRRRLAAAPARRAPARARGGRAADGRDLPRAHLRSA